MSPATASHVENTALSKHLVLRTLLQNTQVPLHVLQTHRGERWALKGWGLGESRAGQWGQVQACFWVTWGKFSTRQGSPPGVPALVFCRLGLPASASIRETLLG